MDRANSITQIRQACKNISLELMKIHPAVPGLADKATQDDLYKTLFELTKQIEIIKKQLAKLETTDDSPEL